MVVGVGSGPFVTGVVLLAFVGLAVPRVRGWIPSRAATAALGGAAAVALGGLSPETALRSIDPTTLLLIFGMVVHVEVTATSGVYGWTAAALVNRTGTHRRLTLSALVLAAGLSAVALNDATVVLLTPVFVDAVRKVDADPTIPLVGVVVGANVGSLATPLGNPQNAYILARSGVSTGVFVRRLAPVAFVCLCVAAVVLVPVAERRRLPSVSSPRIDRGRAALGGGFVVGTLLLLVAFPRVDVGALAAGTALVHLAVVGIGSDVSVTRMLRRLDRGILILFVGLFVLTAAIRTDGAFAPLLNVVARSGVVGHAAVTFALSATISNVPAVLLLAPGVSDQTAWLRLAAVSTLAGNATPVASAATLIVLERARRAGTPVSIPRLVVVGFPVSVLTTLVALAMV